jgi:hypothetical protein
MQVNRPVQGIEGRGFDPSLDEGLSGSYSGLHDDTFRRERRGCGPREELGGALAENKYVPADLLLLSQLCLTRFLWRVR